MITVPIVPTMWRRDLMDWGSAAMASTVTQHVRIPSKIENLWNINLDLNNSYKP